MAKNALIYAHFTALSLTESELLPTKVFKLREYRISCFFCKKWKYKKFLFASSMTENPPLYAKFTALPPVELELFPIEVFLLRE